MPLRIQITIPPVLALELFIFGGLLPEPMGPTLEDYWSLRTKGYRDTRGPNGFTYTECCSRLRMHRESTGNDRREQDPR